MNQQCKNGFVKRLRNETRPLHVLLNDQTLACFIPETQTILNLSDIAHLLGFSETGIDRSVFENAPILRPENVDNGFVALGNHSSIRHPSAFFLLMMQTSKPSSVSMIRWLVQDVFPKTAIFKTPLATVTDDLELKQLIGRPKDQLAGQILVKLQNIKVSAGKPSSKLNDAENLVEGGEGWQKS